MRRSLLACITALLVTILASAPSAGDDAKPLRAGIIGLDTSHVAAFTELLNGPKATGDLAGIRGRGGVPGGSPDIPASRDRARRLHQDAPRQVRRRDRRFDRRAAARRSTSCCWKASTAGRTWSRSGRCSRRASRCSSTSRWPARWPTPSRFIELAKQSKMPVLLQFVAALRPEHPDRREAIRRSARCSAAMPTAPARWSRTIPICSGTASTASRRCSRSWAPAANR